MSGSKHTPQVLPHNGAILLWLSHPWNRWSITGSDGTYHGLRASYADALAFAATLPGVPYVPPPAPTLSRSERARGYWGEEPQRVAPMGVPAVERDFDFAAPSSGAPEPPNRDPIAESREKSRRQSLAHDQVYGRYRR